MSKQRYVKKDQITHIIDRPDMYVGSTKSRVFEEFVVVDDKFSISKKNVNVSPAILRIFIEPLSNIIDNVARSRLSKTRVSKICVDIDEATGVTSLWNDGEVIPIEMHPEEKCYNHTMIFGQLLTSSNYDDDEDRKDISGRNGLGVKLSCVFSKEFTVEGVDPNNKKSFRQTWRNNMKEVGDPIVKASKLTRGYTKITYTPDFSQFGLSSYTADIISLYKRFVVDTAMITKLSVFYNGEEVPVKSLVDYSKLYGNYVEDEHMYIKTSECEVVLIPSEDWECISFANGVYTPLGGTHVNAWSEAIFRPIVAKFNTAKKAHINITDVKKFFRLFVVATVKKPEFDSQSKTKLEAPEITAVVKKTHIQNILKWSVIAKIEDIIRAKEFVILKKTERKKRGHEKIEGLDPANNEGGPKSLDCTLILVEGLSAKTYAVTGIQKGVFGKSGRDWYGIYPLRGKCLNTRNATPASIVKNEVITNIIKALGLQYGVDYTIDKNFEQLRYGKVLIIVDADVDGIHISGLLQNFFHSLFPSLLKRNPPFLLSMQTPIVRVMGKKDILFYDEREYKKYVQEMYEKGVKKINKKYYKGLGTSNNEDIEESFGEKMIEFKDDEKSSENMNKVFNKKYSHLRKDWLANYDTENIVLKWNGDKKECLSITHSDFINTEMIKFSIADCGRNIPNLLDGFKEGHRKVLYVTLLRNLKYSGKTLKVAQLAGSVAEKSAYHHGEQNLYKTITGMGSKFVGSNNIPFLFDDGQFGSRLSGGDDAANGRYIYTKLERLTRLIFRPEDDILLEHNEDDGEKVEPRFYVPIIPTILVNGCSAGIGTGWSSSVPSYNPVDLIASVKAWLECDGEIFTTNEDMNISLLPEIKPWYRGYKGEIVKESENKYVSYGVLENEKNKVVIKELPVGYWTNDFTDSLETMKEDKTIANYKNYSTKDEVNFVITESKDGLSCDLNTLKLYKYIHATNMVLFDENGKLKKYKNTDEIIDSYCKVRYHFYTLRKKHLLNSLEHDIKFLGNKKRFLEEVRDGEIKLFYTVKNRKESRKTADIVKELEDKKYDKDLELVEEDEDTTKHGYEYLLRLQISSITAEKIDKLRNDIENLITRRDELKSTSEKQLWLNDLIEFEQEYLLWLRDLSNKKSKVVKKTK